MTSPNTTRALLALPLSLAMLVLACGPSRLAASTEGDEGEGSEDSSTADAPDPTSTATEATEDTDTEDTSDTEGGEDFVPDTDDSDPVPCNSFLQDCPEGEKCVLYASSGGSWDAFKCVPVLGEQATGEPCIYDGNQAATDDCDETGACWGVAEIDGALVGTCHAFCTGTPDAPMCPPGSSCLITGDGSVNLCISSCDPLLQDCGPGNACYWANNDFNCLFTAEDLPPGAACSYINDCAGGLICVDTGVLPDCADAACCTSFCELGLGDLQCDAVPGTSCVPFFAEGEAPLGYELLGLCVLP